MTTTSSLVSTVAVLVAWVVFSACVCVLIVTSVAGCQDARLAPDRSIRPWYRSPALPTPSSNGFGLPRCGVMVSLIGNGAIGSRMELEMNDATTARQFHLTRRSSAYWRVTFDHPPLNIFGPATIPQLDEIITALEADERLKVVVFDSAVAGFFMTHYDFLAKPEDTTRLSPGPIGLGPLNDMLVRLS